MIGTQSETAEFVIAKIEARRSATLVQAAALVGVCVCVVLAALLQNPINRQRQDLQLVLHSNIYKELPPEYAWVSAAGGTFRGLAADLLWMRADKLKEEGRYYELHQLAKWICTLQPRFPTVWSFQSWNMSYNISVATHTAQERWQWVYNGIRLLRDEGIPNNVRVVPLYQQVAWIWFHKVGDRLDDFHMTYKRMWAATMDTLLGSPPAAVSDAETIDWFRPVANAPQRLEDLIAARPGVETLVTQLRGLGVDPEATTTSQRVYHPLEEQFFRKYAAWQQERQAAPFRKQATSQPAPERLETFFEQAPKEDFDALLAFLRAKVLREQYKMDPAFMLAMTGRLGTEQPVPIDWRTPWSQSLYWAMYGVDRGRELKSSREFDLIAADRVLLFSITGLSKSGRYVFRLDPQDPMNSFLNMMPDLRYIEAMHQKYLELGPKHSDPGDEIYGPAGETLRSGHVNELQNAVIDLYLAGHRAQAQKYLDYLAKHYRAFYTWEVQDLYTQGLDHFVQSQIKDRIESMADAGRMVFSLLSKGYLALAGGYVDEFTAAVRNAGFIYNEYMQGRTEDAQGRRALPPFAQMRADTLVGFVLDQSNSLLTRSMVWNREQNDVRQRAYDFVRQHLAEQCERENLDVKKAFPEPVGMEAFRKANPKLQQVYQKKTEDDSGEK